MNQIMGKETKKKAKRFILLEGSQFLSNELQEYNGKEVVVEVIKEIRRGVFHGIFPNGFRTDGGEWNEGRIILFNAAKDYAEMWKECDKDGNPFF